MAVTWKIHHDRRVAPEFLALFTGDGATRARVLVEYALHAPYPLDFQFRHDPKTRKDWATLYVGLTAVLNVDRTRAGAVRLSSAWGTEDNRFDAGWSGGVADDGWGAVETYLETVIPLAAQSHGRTEGAVQAAASVFRSADRVAFDREAMVHFRDQPTKTAVMGEITASIVEALRDVPGVRGAPKLSYGGKCDLLAVDQQGRLLAVEIKPRGVSTIVWAAAQATVYARIFERWLTAEDLPADGSPAEVLQGMAHQRAELGFIAPPTESLDHPSVVVPVVAVQRGAAPAHLDGLRAVQRRLIETGVGHPDLELHEVNMAGRLRRLEL